MATSCTIWQITNPTGNYWAGGDNWYPDQDQAACFPSKAEAKDYYRKAHGAFPRTLTVTEVTFEVPDDEMADETADAVDEMTVEEKKALLHEMVAIAEGYGKLTAEEAAAHRANLDDANPGTEVEVYEAEVIETTVADDDTIHDGELVDDDDLVQLAADANKHFADFEAAGHNALVAAWNCGAALARAKALVAHGEFKPWVEANFDGSYSLASSYMRIAANVQTSELWKHDSINGVLKAIAAGKDRPAKPARSVETRARNIRQAADKLAAVVAALAADIDTDSGAAIEADLNWAADVVTQAFQRIDNVIYGRDR